MAPFANKQRRLVVLIDAENVSHQRIRPILNRAACYGTLCVKRAFADWSRPQMREFRHVLHRHAIEPVHLFSYARGKNAADIALCLNAMDLVNTGQFDGVCLVTSDSDFTPLVFNLLREGMRVYGFGTQQTPQVLVSACSNFIYTDVLEPGVRVA